ncbi:NDP-sugar epimerase, includes UDP-GlcNAc-inverting 4,6-dehydratase FlaA1 and capsular polysaccharide biosynthesis protein EpsC [Hathewaya proteolytica DSM 3090]|uniref:NDP-sugar epimerase, includes UDP-GlcNAc-inverting 4,6-dehydratase FlaA1 and capsular polysaccharide biosynthesis protein EpsC n=1 Tax=Hathewaya proteolytica DSM 3090 TaxID=1121331 RepID=A0A1M6QSY6_9CLOT|nr:nucleoside-diphosphate sugar epimerase/dehydratase [Hathewaya proteolytica]SHK23429.1 NDP-sugar epimerase, includes UDP-GlcNAc-inverting 4,6-dehydratase FlaA1 and capsular polysaccharide biosynthesis protein EpsC [Hathewaya proteolytica DSM 3090]
MKRDKKLIIIDVILIIASLYLSLLIRFDFGFSTAFKEYVRFLNLSIIPVTLITLFFNKVFNLYDSLWKYASIQEVLSIIYSVSLSNLVFIVYSYFINFKLLKSTYYRFPFTVHIIFWLLSVVCLGGTRLLFRILQEKRCQNQCKEPKKNLLVIGAGDAAALIVKEVQRNPGLNYNVVGLIDDDEYKIGKRINNIPILGGRNKILNVIKEESVDEIIFAMPSVKNNTKTEIMSICKESKCKLKTFPSMDEVIDENFNMSKLRDVSIDDLLGREEIQLDDTNINEYLKDQVVLVTGAGGSIGSELCRQIVKFKPKKLVLLDIYENNIYDIQMELNHAYPKQDKSVIIASIRDKAKLDEVFKKHKPYVVFHAAAHKHVPLMENNPSEAIKNNIIGTYNVLKCCDEFKVRRFVQISTDKAVNPTNIMGATKRFCEIMVQAFDKVSKTEYVAVRFGNVLGSNGSVIPLFKRQISYGGPVTVTHPEINRFFMTIPEAAQLVIQAGAMANGGEIFVLDMGKPVKMLDLAKDLIRLSGFEPDKEIKIVFTGLRPGEKLYEELLMNIADLDSTKHEKIFIEKPMEYSMEFVEKSIKDFAKVAQYGADEIKTMMEEKVPTYKRKD